VSYRTHPLLQKIYSGKIGSFGIDSTHRDSLEKNKGALKAIWEKYVKYFGENIIYISDPFHKAFIDNKDRVASVCSEDYHREDYSGVSGCIILPTGMDICFYTRYYKDPHEWDKYIFVWVKDVLVQMYLGEGRKGGVSEISVDAKDGAVQLESPIIHLLAFIKYCPVEIKELLPNSRDRGINCKYVNETDSNIKVYDSTWFTTLVKSDAFKVRGHFRLQPKKKDGEWTKELIWINEFQKEGYTASARKLNA
jgi:hypothetical protein